MTTAEARKNKTKRTSKCNPPIMTQRKTDETYGPTEGAEKLIKAMRTPAATLDPATTNKDTLMDIGPQDQVMEEVGAANPYPQSDKGDTLLPLPIAPFQT